MRELSWPDLSTIPPAIAGFRAERPRPREQWLERFLHGLDGLRRKPQGGGQRAAARFVAEVERQGHGITTLPDHELDAQLRQSRHALRRHGLNDARVARNFALLREISARTIGMRHYDTQLVCGWLLLRGVIAEMPTGEGKTLAATLAASTAAMAGLPVHVMTVNDYLTRRDATDMEPVYRRAGLSLGVIVHTTGAEQRAEVYTRDIVYGTGKEIVFDYLRDRIVLGRRGHALRHPVEPVLGHLGCADRLLMQGLHFAIIDEADSVLIDEARTPLIISGSGGDRYTRHFLEQALDLAGQLQADRDYRVDRARRRLSLTAEGETRVAHLSEHLGPLWSGSIRREEALSQALSALYLFERDHHYLVRDGKVEIIDPLTGRVTEGRAWERGLHQLIELKEGLAITQQRDTLARISYQSFFRRYLLLSGMTGTAREVRGELWQVFGLDYVAVAPRKPSIRRYLPTRVFIDEAGKWTAIAERARQLSDQGRAVLIGTASVAASEQAARALDAAGLSFRVLNAKQDRYEAEVIAEAGNPRRITIATSMAGRGTDIKLQELVRGAGGLHVILSEHYDSSRVDRQLAGRCARQGDPGSFEVIVGLDERGGFSTRGLRQLARVAMLLGPAHGPGRLLALAALRLEQRFRERRGVRERRTARRVARHQDELLSISGAAE